MSADTTPARLPLVGEAARPPEREVLASGQSAADAPDTPRPAAPIIALHGVGEFAYGDVIGEIARHPVFSRTGIFRRETVFAGEFRFTALMDARGADDPRPITRLLEINWSEVRRAMPNLLGLLRNFVTLLMTLNRVGVHGAYGSTSLSVHLAHWRDLAVARRGGAGVGVAGARVVGAAVAAGPGPAHGHRCHGRAGRAVRGGAGARGQHAAVGGRGGVLGLCRLRGRVDLLRPRRRTHVRRRRCPVAQLGHLGHLRCRADERGGDPVPPASARGSDVRWVHRLARIACLWLPLVMLVVLQPLTVSAMLITMNAGMRRAWGEAFAAGIPFDPLDGQHAASWIALALAGTVVLGALQFKLVQSLGRNLAVVLGWAAGLLMLGSARWLESNPFLDCELCQQCLRTDWLAMAGSMLVLGASVTWVLFSQTESARDPTGAIWYPAGAFARFWASVMLAVMPVVLTATLLWLIARGIQQGGARAPTDASEIFLQSTKYALLLAPLATKPFARFLDALGDVFFFLVRQRSLHTRKDTLPRLWKALRLLDDGVDGCHVVVFAHSQGTVIAAGMLSRMARVLLRSRMRLTLVTVGSPVTTLYRNFLGARIGAEFAALCKAQPERFRWFNLYRPADYIGGEVELDGVVNRDLLTPGDHVGYWCDRDLLKWLKDLSEGRAS